MPHEPFAEALDTDPAGVRIGWLGDWGGAYPMAPGVLATCEAALTVFADHGCTVEPVAPPFPAERLWESWIVPRSRAIAARLAPLYADPAKRERMKPELLWEIERGRALSAMAVHDASVTRSARYARLAELFDRHDALALPAAQVWPFPADLRWPDEVAGRSMDTYHCWMEIVVPVSLAGVPCLSLPAGFGAQGLPMGIQLFGPHGAHQAILRLGQAYHRATDWPGRRPPPSCRPVSRPAAGHA